MHDKSRTIAVFCALLALSACDQTSNETADTDVLAGTESVQQFGEYTIHFNAVSTSQLTPSVAQSYGIVRSPDRALLNISILRTADNGRDAAVNAEVSASAVNLTGQIKNVPMREISEDTAIYYIGETVVADAETLIFTIEAVPEGESETLTFRFQKQFFVD